MFFLQVIDFLGYDGFKQFCDDALIELQTKHEIQSDELRRCLRLRSFNQKKHEYESDERCGNFIKRGKDGLFYISEDIK